MMFRNRKSPTLEKARQRAAKMGTIESNLDLGNGLTLPYYLNAIETADKTLEAYNNALVQLTRLYEDAIAAESVLTDLNERMFTGVVTKYGRNSTEYKMAGGKVRGRRTGNKTTAPVAAATEAVTEPAIEMLVTASGEQSKNGSRNGNGKVKA
jgi:hypothetical protein